MKMQDILELAKAGYKPSDVFKLLEYKETNPEIQAADLKMTQEEMLKKQKEEDEKDDILEPEKKQEAKKEEEEKELTAEEIMKQLIS